MDRKSFTLIIVSNRKGATHRLSISASWLKAGLALFAVLFVILGACAVDYLGLLSQSIENRRLRAENSILKEQYQVVDGKVATLEKNLEGVKSFVTKLKLITNVDQEDRTLKLSVGPGAQFPAGQYEGGSETSSAGGSMDGSGDFGGPAPMANNGRGAGRSGSREPAGLAMGGHGAKDQVLFSQPPLDENSGEVAVDSQRDYATLSVRIDQAMADTTVRHQGLLDLWEMLQERQSLTGATPSIKPVRGWATSRFGYRVSPFTGRPVMHNGLDIAAGPGAPILAPADGVVSFAGYDPGYGKLVSIDHGYGVVTRYGHTSQIFVEVGQKIKRREVIALVGNTGRSTGPHLHYEVRVNSIPVDPTNYILDE